VAGTDVCAPELRRDDGGEANLAKYAPQLEDSQEAVSRGGGADTPVGASSLFRSAVSFPPVVLAAFQAVKTGARRMVRFADGLGVFPAPTVRQPESEERHSSQSLGIVAHGATDSRVPIADSEENAERVGLIAPPRIIGSRRDWDAFDTKFVPAAGFVAEAWGWDALRPLPGTVMYRFAIETLETRYWVADGARSASPSRLKASPEHSLVHALLGDADEARVIEFTEIWTGTEWYISNARHAVEITSESVLISCRENPQRLQLVPALPLFKSGPFSRHESNPLTAFEHPVVTSALLTLWHPSEVGAEIVLRLCLLDAAGERIPAGMHAAKIPPLDVLDLVIPHLGSPHRRALGILLKKQPDVARTLLLSPESIIRELAIRSIGTTTPADERGGWAQERPLGRI